MLFHLPLRSLLLSTSILAACAAQPPAPAPADAAVPVAASQSDSICSKEYPTGSHIAVTTCRTREQVEAERRAGTKDMERAQTGGGTQLKKGGG